MAYLVWFIFPLFITSIVNLVLFIKTLCYCNQVKNELKKLKESQTMDADCKIFTFDKER